MRRTPLLIAATALLFAACGGAQRHNAGIAGAGPLPVDYQEQLPAGTRLSLALDAPLSAARAAIGQTVRAHTVQEVRGVSGELLVPRDAVVTARVIDREGEQATARVWLRVETLTMAKRVQDIRGELVGASAPDGKTAIAFTDQSLRGEVPAGARLDIELSKPATTLSAIRARYYQ